MEQIEQYMEQFFTNLTTESLFFVTILGLTLCLGIALSALKHARGSKVAIGKHTRKEGTSVGNTDGLEGRIQDLEHELASISAKLPRTAIVRFNPFRDSGVGGNQSFSLATLDEQGNGSLITHLFSREMSRVSAKQIAHWQSDLELSPEEKQAIDQLRKK